MPHQSMAAIVATIGIDIGKNTFHLVGLDQRGNIVLQLKTSRQQLERRLANVPCYLIGMDGGFDKLPSSHGEQIIGAVVRGLQRLAGQCKPARPSRLA